MKPDEKEFLLGLLNGLKEILEENQQGPNYDKEILLSRLNEIKEFLLQEEEPGLTSTDDRPFAVPLDLRKSELEGR